MVYEHKQIWYISKQMRKQKEKQQLEAIRHPDVVYHEGC